MKLKKRQDGKIVDKHGNVQKTFDDHTKKSKTADEVKVASDATSSEIARAAIMQNAAYALSNDFNIADGEYLIGGRDDPEYKAYAIREGGELIGLRLQVEPWAVKLFKHELKIYKDRWEDSDKSEIAESCVPARHVTGWIVEYLNFHYGVHPMDDSKAFDKVLAEEMPECFITPRALKEAKNHKTILN